MRVAGIDHDSNSSEYSGELGERDVSKRREICLLWIDIISTDALGSADRTSSKSYIHSDEYENSKILSSLYVMNT